MKRFVTLILPAVFILHGFSQISSGESQKSIGEDMSSGRGGNIKVIIGRDLLCVEESDSAVRLRIANRGLNILESPEGTKLNFEKYKDNDESPDNDKWPDQERRRNRFKGHWSGVELGFNNFLTSDMSLSLPADINYMSLHSGKSMNFNINFSQLSFGLMRHTGFVTGLGLNWNNYKFDGNNNIVQGINGIIEELDPGADLEKSKLATLYLNFPFMLEIQLPAENSTLNVAAGPIGAIKLGSHSKMVYKNGEKIKSNKDFSLNILRCGATARVGYKNFHLYGTYYFTPLFNSGKGPGGYELHPFEIGAAFTIKD